MRSLPLRSTAAWAALALVPFLLAWTPAPAGRWGTVKGQVVFAGQLPANPDAEVARDKEHCLSKGPIKQNVLVVNPKNRGVRWVLVWLAPLKGFNNPANVPPCLPAQNKVPPKLQISASCCAYTPRVLAIREGTTLVFKNKDTVPHNAQFDGGNLGPHVNRLLPAKTGVMEVKDVKARLLPCSYRCAIHPWMKGWIGVFKHPHFAVTDADGKFEIKDAPAGKWRLILWQEKVGFVVQRSPNDRGKIITIKARSTTTHKITLVDRD
jgi:hypothetical protein